MEKKDIKVKKDHFVAKILCGSLIPIGVTGTLIGVAYHSYWHASDAIECHMWKDTDGNYIWEGNVNRAAKFNFVCKFNKDDADAQYNKIEILNDGKTVPIKKIAEIRNWAPSFSNEKLCSWQLKDGVGTPIDDNELIKAENNEQTNSWVNITLLSGFKGYVKIILYKK